MLQVVHCSMCGEHTCPPGAVTATITLSHAKWCQCCHESKGQSHAMWFCSPACLVRYVDERADAIMRNAEGMRSNPDWPYKVTDLGGSRQFESAVEE